MDCSEDQFLCSICLEVFTDPVTTACGHSFCNICINKHWDNCVHCHCSVCKEEFCSRPQLKTNIFISEMVSEFKNKPQRDNTETSESEAAAAGDVLCDVCREPKLKALKSCLVCQTSYCPDHLTPHNTVPRLKKHQLIPPVQNLEERICPEHDQVLMLFCRDHSQLICLQCSCSEHRDHSTVPLKDQCEEEQNELQQKIQERQKKLQELQRSVQLSQENADKEMKEGVDFFNDLMKCVQQSLDQFKEYTNKKHQEVKEKVEGFVKEIESEISVLKKKQVQMEEMWSSKDHFNFIQTFTKDKSAPELNDWTEVSVRAPSYEGRLTTAVSDLWVNKINPKMKKVLKDKLDQVKKHTVDVTLDPDTAHHDLYISQNNKQVQYSKQKTVLPDRPERFSELLYVLGKQKFATGKFYFEVQVKGKTCWCLGVASEFANRKVKNASPQNCYWRLYTEKNSPHFWSGVDKVGVFVDYDEGLIIYFDAETSAFIHGFTDCCFTGNILPLFSPCRNIDGNNSAPLIITAVNE